MPVSVARRRRVFTFFTDWMDRMAATRRKQNRRKPTQAQQADKYELYLASVQEPSAEVAFFNRVFRKEFGRPPVWLREDFAGTAAVCYEWVKSRRDRRAIAVDLDPEPLEWGRENLAPKLKPEQRERVQLLQQDVREVSRQKVDVLAAQNFSFYIFQTRRELVEYFQAARKNLRDDGIFVLDMVGGPEAMEGESEEEQKKNGFTYVWEQTQFNPIDHTARFFISFRFRDGSELRRAFDYDWRLWMMPEVREALLEAGFSRADVYWEGTDRETGEGNGVYTRRERADSDPSWVAYVVAVK